MQRDCLGDSGINSCSPVAVWCTRVPLRLKLEWPPFAAIDLQFTLISQNPTVARGLRKACLNPRKDE